MNIRPPHPGNWRDFTTGERGDALDLIAAVLFRGDLKAALPWARSWLGIAGSGPPPRPVARTVEAPAEALAKALEAGTRDAYGTAGPAFLDWLVPRAAADPAWLPERWREHLARWNRAVLPAKADGQVARAGRRFALIALAGELATEAGVTGWGEGEATRGAAACFEAWLLQRGTEGGRELAQLIQKVRWFVLTHGQSRFETIKEAERTAGDLAEGEPRLEEGRQVINRAGWRWQEQAAADGPFRWVYGIQAETFEKEICQHLGQQPREARKLLAAAGVIRTGRNSEGKTLYTLTKRIPGLGRMQLVWVEPWGDDAEGGDD